LKRFLSKKFFSSVFIFVGIALSVLAVGFSLAGYRENEMMQAIAFGVAALACFKSSEFLAK